MRNILDNKTRGKKKGVIGMIILFMLLLTIVIIGFISVMIISSIDYVSDELTPIMTDLGIIDEGGADINMKIEGKKVTIYKEDGNRYKEPKGWRVKWEREVEKKSGLIK